MAWQSFLPLRPREHLDVSHIDLPRCRVSSAFNYNSCPCRCRWAVPPPTWTHSLVENVLVELVAQRRWHHHIVVHHPTIGSGAPRAALHKLFMTVTYMVSTVVSTSGYNRAPCGAAEAADQILNFEERWQQVREDGEHNWHIIIVPSASEFVDHIAKADGAVILQRLGVFSFRN